jgi:hypothetical protein
MPIQPGLALQLKGAELPDPMAQFAQATQIQNALQQQRMGEMQIQNAMREQQRTRELEGIMSGLSPTAPAAEVAGRLQQRGFFQQAGQMLQQAALRDKAEREARAARFTETKTKAELAGRIFSGVTDQDSYTAARTRAIQDELVTPNQIPEIYDKGAVDRIINNAIDVSKAFDLRLKELEAGASVMRAEAARSQAATAAAKLSQDRIPTSAQEAQWLLTATPAQKEAFYAAKRAGSPTTTVNIDQKGELAEQVKRGEGYVKHETDVRNAATAARKSLVSIESAQDVLAKGFDTGFATETKAKGASVLAALGVKDAEAYATDAQKFLQATMNQVLATQTEQKGVQTDQDAQRIKQATAQMSNTKAANEFILDVARAQAERAIAQDKFYRDWLRDPDNKKSLAGAEDAWMKAEGDKSIFESPRLQKYGVFASKRPATPPPAGPVVGGRSATPRGRPSITERPQTPSAGDVMDGYRFKGGNPADENNWEKVGG